MEEPGIEKLKGVGEKRKRQLERLGIKSIKDLFYYFPRDYLDLRRAEKINAIKSGFVVIKAKVISVDQRRSFRRYGFTITSALLADETGSIEAVWFNQPYMQNVLRPTGEYIFYGKAKIIRGGAWQLQSPKLEKNSTILPVYRETSKLTSKYIASLIKQARPAVGQIKDFLPQEIRLNHSQIPLQKALWAIHFPSSIYELEKARERLAFDELLNLFWGYIKHAQKAKKSNSLSISTNVNLLKTFVSSLPFKLTNDQRIAAWHIIKKMNAKEPLNALLNGDVGSGKTIVALIASLAVVDNGYNAVWLAPTTVLAKQHYDTILSIVAKKANTKLVTAVQAKNKKREKKSNSKGSIIVGTHAVLHRESELGEIGLLVVDEEHRFGVEQRGQLLRRNNKLSPHLLSMTATPIPRSLAMMLGGMVELINIKEKPLNRQKIITKVIDGAHIESAYDIIKKELEKGHQAFIIAPAIDKSEASLKKSLAEVTAQLQKSVLKKYKTGVIHGKMKDTEKQKTMKQMNEREISILVATSVVEVGIDIANATVIMIENAEYFGLAQLHQLRGRVGRSSYQSYCLLVSSPEMENAQIARQRLEILEKTNNGFEIAQKDLELRGPGAISGLEQSGFITLKIASLFDEELIARAKKAAEELYNTKQEAQ